jgi:hypothetical protein
VLAHNLESFRSNAAGVFDDLMPNDHEVSELDLTKIREADVLDWTKEEK